MDFKIIYSGKTTVILLIQYIILHQVSPKSHLREKQVCIFFKKVGDSDGKDPLDRIGRTADRRGLVDPSAEILWKSHPHVRWGREVCCHIRPSSPARSKALVFLTPNPPFVVKRELLLLFFFSEVDLTIMQGYRAGLKKNRDESHLMCCKLNVGPSEPSKKIHFCNAIKTSREGTYK